MFSKRDRDGPIFRYSNPANVARPSLQGNRDHLLTETRSELTKQEQKVESLNSCINELLQQPMLNDWNDRTPITDTLNLDENKCDYKKN